MLLLLSALAAADTFTVGPGDDADFQSIYDVMEHVGPDAPFEVLLLPDYVPSVEYSTLSEFGLNLQQDVTIRSSQPGLVRRAPPLYIKGEVQVVLEDLDFSTCSAFGSYASPHAAQVTQSPSSCLYASGGAVVEGDNLIIEGQDLTAQKRMIAVFGADLTLRNSRFQDNVLFTDIARDEAAGFQSMAYAVSSVAVDGQPQSLVIQDTQFLNTGGGVYVDGYDGYTSLQMDGGRIWQTETARVGSAVRLYGEVDSQVNGLVIEDAKNSAVQLHHGINNWNDIQMRDVLGTYGGAFYLESDAALSLSGGQFVNTDADRGGLVYLTRDNAVVLKNVEMIGGQADFGAALYGDDTAAEVEIWNSRFCGLEGPGSILDVPGELLLRNTVFRQLQGSAVEVGLELDAVNNTFVDIAGPVIHGVPQELTFINNAVVGVESLGSGGLEPVSEIAFNLFYDSVVSPTESGFSLSEDNLLQTAPGFHADYENAPQNCGIDPVLAYNSPMIDAGDPEILDADNSRSDIGAFGGPDGEDGKSLSDQDNNGLVDAQAVTLLGGCGSTGSAAALFLFPGLLALRRRRRR